MVTPLGFAVWVVLAVKVTEVKSGKVGDGRVEPRGAVAEDLQGALPFFAAIGSHQIEVVPVALDLSHEVGATGEALAVEELCFLKAVDGFDIALPGIGFGWDVTMVAAQSPYGGGQASGLFIFQELAAVVGLPDHATEVNAMIGQMGADPFGQQAGVGFGDFVGVAHQTKPTDHLAHTVLIARQAQTHHLRPVEGNIGQILGIGHQLAEEFPAAFDLPQTLLALVFFETATGELVGAQDAGSGPDAGGDVKLLLEPLGAEACLVAQAHDEAFDAPGSLMRTMTRALGEFGQTRRLARLVSAQPFAHGIAGAAQGAGGGFDAVLTSIFQQTLA
jgi:hypothetical protein